MDASPLAAACDDAHRPVERTVVVTRSVARSGEDVPDPTAGPIGDGDMPLTPHGRALARRGVGLVVETVVEPGQRRGAQMLRSVQTVRRSDMPQQGVVVHPLMGMSNRPPLGGLDHSIGQLLHARSPTHEPGRHHD